MGIPIRCPKCERSYKLKDSLGGKVVLCECGAKLRVPERKAGAAPKAAPSASSSAELPVAAQLCPRCRRTMPHDARIRVCSGCGFDLDDPEGSVHHSGLHPGADEPGPRTAVDQLRENSLVVWLLVNVIAAGVVLLLAADDLLPQPDPSWGTAMTFGLYMAPFCAFSYWLIERLLR